MTKYANGEFVTICADPPWQYGDKLRMSSTKRSASDNYDTMTVPEICGLRKVELESNPLNVRDTIADHAIASTAFLFLWVTNSFLLDGSGVTVCKAWGFQPKQLITWVKGRVSATKAPDSDGDLVAVARLRYQIGMGHYTRGATEHVILGVKGRTPTKLIKDRGLPNVFLEPKGGHSEKPEAFYEGVEKLVPGPYLELFARRERPGWITWGNQL